MRKQGKLPCDSTEFMKTLASHQDSEGRNLLHEAAHAVIENDPRYFTTLLHMRFPLYGEDVNLDFAAFYICKVQDEQTFVSCFKALIKSGFGINKENDDDETFLQRLCLSQFVSQSRIAAVLEHQPDIDREQLSSLIAKHAISKQRANKATKLAIQVIRAYVDQRQPPPSPAN